jgi:hypothetical protein
MKIEEESKVIKGTNLTKGQIFVGILDRNFQRSGDVTKDFRQVIHELDQNANKFQKPNLMIETVEEEDK